MIQLPFLCTIQAQPRNVRFSSTKTMVRIIQNNDSQPLWQFVITLPTIAHCAMEHLFLA